MKRDKRRVSLFTPLLGGPHAAATRRPLEALSVLGALGVLAGAR